MRFLIKLQIPNSGLNVLPINYQYELSSVIYKLVNQGDNVFAEWLHSSGYSNLNKNFKLFVFSMLEIPKKKIENQCITILSDEICFKISFLLDEIAEPFIYGMFKNREIVIGDKYNKVKFFVSSIERLNDISFNNPVKFRTISPIVISHYTDKNNSHPTYIPPDNPKFADLLFQNLINKNVAVSKYSSKFKFFTPDADLQFDLIGEFKQKLIKIKTDTPQQTMIKGFMFDFKVSAPQQLLQIAYHAGCGEKNSLGFGCVEVN